MEETEGKNLKEKLFNEKENGWIEVDSEKEKVILKFSDEYIYFLNKGKTERECTSFAKKMLEENGFQCICEYESLKPGDKIYYINRDKSLYAAIIGKQNLEEGIHVIGRRRFCLF